MCEFRAILLKSKRRNVSQTLTEEMLPQSVKFLVYIYHCHNLDFIAMNYF